MHLLHVPVNTNDQKQGNDSAPLTLVEYGDYECPHCGHAYPVIKMLQRHFGDRLQFVYRNFPLTEMHPHALPAAQVAESAGLQNKFWPVHDLIFEHQENLSTPNLINHARTAGTDVTQLKRDMESNNVMLKVEDDIEGGARSGVNGTPTFFINGNRYDGSYDFESLKDTLEQTL